MTAHPEILIIGYGNPGRREDGLGPALAQKIADHSFKHITVDQDYQLNVEHAADVAQSKLTIFIDARVQGEAAYEFQRLEAEAPLSFSTHSVSPQAVLFLAQSLFDKTPEAYLLSIRGYQFNAFGEVLSNAALDNLESAYDFLMDYLHQQINTTLQ